MQHHPRFSKIYPRPVGEASEIPDYAGRRGRWHCFLLGAQGSPTPSSPREPVLGGSGPGRLPAGRNIRFRRLDNHEVTCDAYGLNVAVGYLASHCSRRF